MIGKIRALGIVTALVATVLCTATPSFAATAPTGPARGAAVTAPLLLDEVNNVRQQNGLAPLTYDSRLQTSATNHTQTMVNQDCFAIQCPNEPSLSQRIQQAGYNWSVNGENIAAGYDTAADVVAAWMQDPGSRKILLGNYKNMGAASITCDSCDYSVYWTLDLASPRR